MLPATLLLTYQLLSQQSMKQGMHTGGARRGKGTGNPGKPGKRLRLADLQGQFGVGLKEAANRLGICPTTLKVGLQAYATTLHQLANTASEEWQ